ncbi:MAG: hypothetical protein H6Q70_2193 [Firmicutes bacterium]|nr:hypothetical protein [Bacillota bacterium]
MSEIKHITRSVDSVTGQIISRNEYSINDEKGYLFWRNKAATKSFESMDLPNDLKDYEVAKLYRLNSNMIMYRSGNVMKAMQIEHIGKYLCMSDRQVKTFMRNMIARKIIARADVKIGNDVQVQYYINPMFFFSGKWLSLNLYLLFKKELDCYLPVWVISRFNEK